MPRRRGDEDRQPVFDWSPVMARRSDPARSSARSRSGPTKLQRCSTVGDSPTAWRGRPRTLWPVDLDKASLVVYHDAAWANAELDDPEDDFKLTPNNLEAGTMKKGPYSGDRHRRAKRSRSRVASQLGHLIFLGEAKEEENTGTHLSLLERRSQACQRVCRSTFGAETMPRVEGLENAQYIRALLASLLKGRLVKLGGPGHPEPAPPVRLPVPHGTLSPNWSSSSTNRSSPGDRPCCSSAGTAS